MRWHATGTLGFAVSRLRLSIGFSRDGELLVLFPTLLGRVALVGGPLFATTELAIASTHLSAPSCVGGRDGGITPVGDLHVNTKR
jgi:hypothetical protein